jgi:signal transduction histidine kinase
VRRANAAACHLLGGSSDEILARPLTALLAGGTEEIESLADALHGAARKARCALRLRGPSGAVRTLDVSIAPLGSGSRVLVLRDMTEHSERMLQLARSNEELDHGIGALAHDLRSPLLGLLGFSRLLRQDYVEALDDTGRHFVDRIEQAGRTMQSLIDDLLALARIGEPGERPELVDWHGVLRQLAAEMKPRLEEAGISLELPEAGGSRVYCDRPRLYQVFSNLIGNAIDHMGRPEFPRVEVQVVESDDGHEIVVTDNGRGVDPGDRERIFEIFQSVGKRADGLVGTGMGLAIVKKIVERRGGRVWVDSAPLGGAAFHATFPRR